MSTSSTAYLRTPVVQALGTSSSSDGPILPLTRSRGRLGRVPVAGRDSSSTGVQADDLQAPQQGHPLLL
eukprot:763296-Hanusia_phi.AAC.1